MRFQGRPYIVAGLGWEHVTLLDDSLAPVAVLRGLLLCDPTFEVLGHQVASSGTVEPLAQLGLVDEAELERVRELERHLLEVSAAELAGEMRADYDRALPVGTRGWRPLVPITAIWAGLAAALLIGTIAGLYPALRAARLAPTDALRAT